MQGSSEHDRDAVEGGRRRFLTRAGVGLGVAWVAPTVLSAPAQAQTSTAGPTTTTTTTPVPPIPGPPVFGGSSAATVDDENQDPTRITLELDADVGDLVLAIVSLPVGQTLTVLDGFTILDTNDVSVPGGSNARVILLRRSVTGPLTSVSFVRNSPFSLFKAALAVYSPATGGSTVEFDTFAAGVDATDVVSHAWPAVVPGAVSPQRTIVRLGGQRSNAAGNPTSWDGVTNPATNVRVQDIPDFGGSRTLHIGDDLNAGATTGSSSAARASVQYTVAVYTS